MEYRPLDYFRRAEEAAQRGDVDLKIDILKELVSLCQLSDEPTGYYAEALRWLGNAYQDKHDIPVAHSYRIEASKVVEALGPSCDDSLTMFVTGDLGRSFIELREWVQAEEHTRRALSIAEAMGETSTGRSARCIYRMNLGLILASLGQREEAIRLGEQVLEDAELLDILDEPHYIQALQNSNLASFHLHANRLNMSQKHARRAMVYADFCHHPWIRRGARKILGESNLRAWRETGDTDYRAEAERLLKEAVRDADRAGDYSGAADTELELATLAAGRGRDDLAALRCERAIEALERSRSVLGFEEFSQTYFSHWEATYEKVTQVQLRRQDFAGAFLTSERSRSRLLLARLGSQKANFARWSPAEQSELANVLNQYGTEVISACRSDLTRGQSLTRTFGLRNGTGQDETSDPQGIRDARAAYIQLQDRQRLYSTRWSINLLSPTALHSEIQKCLRPDDAIIVFQVCDDAIVVFALTSEAMNFQHVPYARDKLAADVQQTCNTMAVLEGRSLARLSSALLRREWWSRRPGQPHPSEIEQPYRQLLSLLQKLFSILIAPILPALEPKKNWVIVPHGPLHRVPWAALWTGSRFVIEGHNFALLPSASFAPTIARHGAQSGGKGAFLFGAPDQPGDPLALPGAVAELEAAALTLGLPTSPQVGASAKKELFYEQAPYAGLIHVAAHHFFDGSAPGLSFLKLAGDEGSRFVYACEVAEMQLAAQLAVLSACDTARSYVVTGDEQYGMVRSFLAAGVHSVISTLWAIEDQSATQFFSEFYQGSVGAPLIEALANAQRTMMKTSPYDLPYFWAPYVLSGEWGERLQLTC